MAINIGKYQLPHIEYNIFNDYIVENLCVERNNPDNCCLGSCYLEKQIESINERDESSDNSSGKRFVEPQTDDFIVGIIPQGINCCTGLLFVCSGDVNVPKRGIEVPVPPPKRFI
ncbi:MAG: hypothetical protein LBH04_03730 [Tannerellaceae bacterium]|nr:hypothetical protein [Tannerellaceae bacterium]